MFSLINGYKKLNPTIAKIQQTNLLEDKLYNS